MVGDRLKALWVTPHLPDPQRGGGWSTEYEFLRLAARRHDVTLLCGGLRAGETTPALAALDVEVRPVPWDLRRFPPNRIAHLWRLATVDGMVEFWQKQEARDNLSTAVRQAETEHDYDLVQVLLGEMAPVIEATRAPTALFLFDVYTRHLGRLSTQAEAPRHRFMWAVERRKVERWERRWYPKADTIACVSEVDAGALKTLLPGRTPSVIPLPIPDEFFEEPDRPRRNNAVALISTLDYGPNIDAAVWFVNDIWPRISAQIPEATLDVVGRSPGDEVRGAVRQPGVELHADVPDARPYYWEAAVSVIPVRLGGGMRNKVLHAMATNAPIVTTTAAIEGIGIRDEEHVVLADEPGDFADAVVRVLRDPEGTRARAARARQFAEVFNGDAIGELLDRWWRDTAALRTRSAHRDSH